MSIKNAIVRIEQFRRGLSQRDRLISKTALATSAVLLTSAFAGAHAETLEANSGVIVNGGTGPQLWGDGVTLSALNIDGSPGSVVYDTQFRDRGFGVAGARWDQIDYYVDYQGEEVNASEALIIDFDGPVSSVSITVGMLGLNEGRGSDDETGRWLALDADGALIAEGGFGPNDSSLGAEIKIGGYGIYPIDVDVAETIHSLRIEATGFAYGEGEPRYVSRYDNDSGNTENNSDFNLMAVSYERGDQVNRAPLAVDDRQFVIREDIGPTGITYATLLANDSDPDGDDIRIVDFDFNGFPGQIENLSDDESILFTTEQDFAGQIEFSYTITDGEFTSEATIELSITDIPEPTPTIAPTIVPTPEPTPVPTLVPSPTAVPTLTPTLTPTPVPTVVPTAVPNRAPVAADDRQFRIREDIGLTGIEYTTLLANDSDPDGDSIRIQSFDFTGFPGEISDIRDRERILFTTAENFAGIVTFSYIITDGRFTSEATIELDITAVNDEPVIGQDGPFRTQVNEALEISIAELLENDADPDADDEVVFVGARAVSGGIIEQRSDTLVFFPDEGFTGEASFIYVITSNDQFDSDITSDPIVINIEAIQDDALVEGSWVLSPLSSQNSFARVASQSNRTPATLGSCASGIQTWTFDLLENGNYLITSDESGKALEAWARNPGNNDAVSLYSVNERSWQQWQVTGSQESGYVINGVFNPRAMTANDGEIIVSDFADKPDQRWTLTPLEAVDCATENEATVLNGDFYIQPQTDAQKTLGVDRFSNRQSVFAKDCSAGSTKWQIRHLGDGIHSIVHQPSRQAIEAWQPTPQNFDDVTVYRSNGLDWQRWLITEQGDGSIQLQGLYNTRLMTLSDTNNNVQMVDNDASALQAWTVSESDPCSLSF